MNARPHYSGQHYPSKWNNYRMESLEFASFMAGVWRFRKNRAHVWGYKSNTIQYHHSTEGMSNPWSLFCHLRNIWLVKLKIYSPCRRYIRTVLYKDPMCCLQVSDDTGMLLVVNRCPSSHFSSTLPLRCHNNKTTHLLRASVIWLRAVWREKTLVQFRQHATTACLCLSHKFNLTLHTQWTHAQSSVSSQKCVRGRGEHNGLGGSLKRSKFSHYYWGSVSWWQLLTAPHTLWPIQWE